MTHRVVIESSARTDIDDAAYAWLKDRSPASAIRWFNGPDAAVRSLAMNPQRCPVPAESEESSTCCTSATEPASASGSRRAALAVGQGRAAGPPDADTPA